MTTTHDLQLVAPFSPTIMKATMPAGLIEQLNQTADRIVASKDEARARDWSMHLAGAVSIEMRVTDLIRESPGLTGFLYDVARTYAYRCDNALLHFSGYDHTEELADKKLRIEIKEGWINDMAPGDYNPVHHHQGCVFSSVGFLRTPPGYEAEFKADKARQNTAGCLQFIDSRSAIGVRNLFTVKPIVGDFYLWPSWMLHCVYPFRSAGTRRSLAVNLALV